MNRIHTTLLALLVLSVALTGSVSANDVDPRDVNFIKTGWSSGAAAEGNPNPWASAGIVSRVDHDFLTAEAGKIDSVGTPEKLAAVGTVNGVDYRLIAGDGSPGATCDIALVAAIHSGC